MSSAKKSGQIAKRPGRTRDELRYLLLVEIAATDTYKNVMISELRPRYANALAVLGNRARTIDDVDIELEERRAASGDMDAIADYVGALDRFLMSTLHLTYDGKPAAWAREAIHLHVSLPRWPAPPLASVAFEKSIGFQASIVVSEGGAAMTVTWNDGEVEDPLEVQSETPFTSFTNWPEFHERAVAHFVRHLERIRTEMEDDYFETGSFRRRGGVRHEYQSVARLARILLSPPRSRSTILRRDLSVENVRSEQESIRAVCRRIGIDSPFARLQKK